MGCGLRKSDPSVARISGRVTLDGTLLDGKLLEQGIIRFIPADNAGPAFGAVIQEKQGSEVCLTMCSSNAGFSHKRWPPRADATT